MSSEVEIDAILAEAQATLSEVTGEGTGGSSDAGAGPAPEAEAPVASPPVDPVPPPAPMPLAEVDLTRILEIEVPVIVRLAHRAMRVKEIMKFATGSIIEFDKAADAELDLMINNEVIGHGQAVKVGENFGLRVLHVLSIQEKIEALGARGGPSL